MMALQYTREEDFTTAVVEFTDEHYKLAENLRSLYKSEILSKCTPLMVAKDEKSLMFCVNLGDKEKDRVAYECGKQSYKIIIEKI